MRASGKLAIATDAGRHPLSPQQALARKRESAPVIPVGRAQPRALAGATILRLVPALRDEQAGQFSPQSVAEAIRGAYISLLARDA